MTGTVIEDVDVLLTMHLSIFILVINQLDAQNFCFTLSLFRASTCFKHHVPITRRSKLYYIASGIITPIGGCPVHRMTTYRSDDTRGCVIQFWPPNTWCSKHVEAWNKLSVKQTFCASSWLITKIKKCDRRVCGTLFMFHMHLHALCYAVW